MLPLISNYALQEVIVHWEDTATSQNHCYMLS